MEQGGSTKPFKVFAIESVNPSSEAAYVVKSFTPSQTAQNPCIAKEFLCNSLAHEFELFVPPCGLINLHTLEFSGMLSSTFNNILYKRHIGPTFASKLLDGTLVAESMAEAFDLNERALIFGFDTLTYNTDRWGVRQKPNLLVHKDRLMLIDHELSLPFIDQGRFFMDSILNELKNDRLVYPYESHLFYRSLKDFKGNKGYLFDTFHEYLNGLGVHRLLSLVKELEANDIYLGSVNLLFEYLKEVKLNASQLCRTLLRSIS